MTNEDEVFRFQSSRNLITLGWVSDLVYVQKKPFLANNTVDVDNLVFWIQQP